jgi:hypothetical protein
VFGSDRAVCHGDMRSIHPVGVTRNRQVAKTG